MEKRWVFVASCVNRLDAEMKASFLGSEGIDSRVVADDAGGTVPYLGLVNGYNLEVRQAQEAAARAALEAVEAKHP